MFSEDTPPNADYDDNILEIYQDKLETPRVGSVTRGTIVQIRENEILIDVGFKSEGIVPVEEFKDEKGNLTCAIGDQVDVYIVRANYGTGESTLSRSKALELATWVEVERAHEEGTEMEAKVLRKIKGGYEVDIKGNRGFLPTSQADLRRRPKGNLTGETVRVLIIQLNRRKKNIVVSRKPILEKEMSEKKQQIFSNLEIGQKIEGKVKNITDYGAFVDIGGVDGLLHVTDLSWGRVNNPAEVLSTGQTLEVMVLNIDPETEKISLGLKQLTEDPWSYVEEKYPPGKKVEGKVVSLVDYGAFVELEPGVEGLLHVSELSWTKKINKPSKVLSVGDDVEVAITDIRTADRKISLSLKQAEPNPWHELADEYQVGQKIKGIVRNLTDFGAFVEIKEGIDGLVHISDIAKNRTLDHPGDVLEKGDEVEAIIVNIDPDRQRISLSIKDATPDEWDDFAGQHEVADTLEGSVSRVTEFGVFVEVAKGVEGLVHITEIKRAPNQRLERMFSPGDNVKVRVIRIEKDQRRLGLSMKDVEEDES